MYSTGSVTFLSTEKVFAFVAVNEGRDTFVHLSRVAVEQRAALEVGQRVEFRQGQRTQSARGVLL